MKHRLLFKNVKKKVIYYNFPAIYSIGLEYSYNYMFKILEVLIINVDATTYCGLAISMGRVKCQGIKEQSYT